MTTAHGLFARGAWVDSAPNTGRNHGMPWSGNDRMKLKEAYLSGGRLSELMDLMGRSALSIISKLKEAGVITQYAGDYYHAYPNPSASPDLYEVTLHQGNTNQLTEENTMTQPANIETVVMIQGQNAANLSDDQIFNLIAKLETQADTLSKIQNKPKKLGLKIEGIHADIKKLIEYVDGRDAA